ncbi:DUF4405 domain-containing protein [Acidobacteriota bacterium]
MKKAGWQYLVDTLLFICMFGITFIGILMAFFLAEGPTALERDKYFMGLHRHQWGDIHLYLSLVFVFLVIVHLCLSWAWIKGKAKNLFKKGWRTALILTVFGACLVLVIFWLFTPKYSQKYAEYGARSGRVSDRPFVLEELMDRDRGVLTLTGQMTLEEMEKITGIPPKAIIDELGLPSKTPRDETLGQLRKKYGFSMVELREIVTELMNRSYPRQESIQTTKEASAPKQQAPDKEDKVQEEEHEQKLTQGRLAEGTSGILITGRMTFRELEEQTGISARTIIDKLGLPASVSLDEHMGRLRRQYGFTLQEVRDIVASILGE